MKFDKIIKEFWFPITAIVSVSVMWGSNATRLSADETRISNIEIQNSQMSNDINSIKVDTAVIKQTVVDIDKQFK